jgi:hypothetical protein
VLLLLISIFFVKAHYESGYEEGKSQTVYYTSTMPILIRRATYDVNLDPWTKEYLGENPKPANFESNSVVQQIQLGFTYVAPAPKKN